MENKITITPASDELTIRSGEAPGIIEPKDFRHIGNIEAVSAYIIGKLPDIDAIKAIIVVNLRKAEIWLRLNVGQENHRLESEIVAALKPNPDLVAFHINTDKRWTLDDLGNFLKFNRRHFASSAANMELVTALKQFRASITRETENASDGKGNLRRLDDKKVSSSLPETFTLIMPLFEGEMATEFTVEMGVDEKDGRWTAYLQSVELLEKREAHIAHRISTELAKIDETGITIIYE